MVGCCTQFLRPPAVITVSRDAQGVWSCNITKTPTAWKPNYAPANCPKS
nr:pilin [Pseudomonas aeruginosa]